MQKPTATPPINVARHRGHPMRLVDGAWVYVDNGQAAIDEQRRMVAEAMK